MIAPWDVALHRSEASRTGWHGRRTGIEPLVSFGHRHGEDCRGGPCGLPSAAEYRRAFAAFRDRWPRATRSRRGTRATIRASPRPAIPRPRATTRVARGLPAVPRARRRGRRHPRHDDLARRFQARLGRRPALWGLQNYGDVTRRRDDATQAMLARRRRRRVADRDRRARAVRDARRHGHLAGGRAACPRASLEYAFALADANAPRSDGCTSTTGASFRAALGLRPDLSAAAPAAELLGARRAPAPRRAAVPAPTPRARAASAGGPPARLDRHGRVRTRLACPRRAGGRCDTMLVVRTHTTRDRRAAAPQAGRESGARSGPRARRVAPAAARPRPAAAPAADPARLAGRCWRTSGWAGTGPRATA